MTNHLFEMPGETFGFDLISLNLQRGREHAIPSYNRYMCSSFFALPWLDLKTLKPFYLEVLRLQ